MRAAPLTPSEHQLIHTYYSRNKMLAPLIPVLGLFVLVIWLANGSDIIAMHYAVAGIIGASTLGATLYISWRLSLLRRDTAEKIKLTGRFRITDTQVNRRKCYIWIDDGKGRRLHLPREPYYKLSKDSTYQFEITPHARTVVKIMNGNEIIYEIRS
jgi:hypothetical protein